METLFAICSATVQPPDLPNRKPYLAVCLFKTTIWRNLLARRVHAAQYANMAHKKFPSSIKPALQTRTQQGFTLIEVLVALIVFTIGLLASAGLMLSSLRATQFAGQSVIGTAFTREYGELMQLIPSSAAATYNAAASGDLSFKLDTKTGTGSNAASCTGSDKKCSTKDMINAMKDDWGKRVQAQLPGGRAEACRDSTAADADGNYKWGDCDGVGEQMRVKLGWHSKKMSDANTDSGGQSWMNADNPRMIVPVMGNLKDYVTQK